jgi:hypothetical protein
MLVLDFNILLPSVKYFLKSQKKGVAASNRTWLLKVQSKGASAQPLW